MKEQWMTTVVTITIAMVLGMFTGSANAADLYSSGAKTWDTSTSNWGNSPGVYTGTTWNNATPDSAIFTNTAGIVSLGENINVHDILFKKTGYTIGSVGETETLTFDASGTLTVDGSFPLTTIRAGIVGSPDIVLTNGVAASLFKLIPGAVDMTIGNIGIRNTQRLYLEGTNANSTISSIDCVKYYQFIYKDGSGTWTVDDISNVHVLDLMAGRLVVNNTLLFYAWSTTCGFSWGGTRTGILAGQGTISFLASNSHKGPYLTTVGANGTLAPGNPTGTMTWVAPCTIAGTLAITIDGTQVSTLAVEDAPANLVGTLDISAATLDVNIINAPSSPVTIATYGAGKRTGVFAATNGLPANWSIDYADNGGTAITLNPPPSGTVLIIE